MTAQEESVAQSANYLLEVGMFNGTSRSGKHSHAVRAQAHAVRWQWNSLR